MQPLTSDRTARSVPREADELYSQRMREWEEQNPEAPPREFEAAAKRIADELGV